MPVSKIIPAFCAALLVCLLISPSVNAQKRLKFSTSEDIAIAFYKTGSVKPNFERWIKERAPYNLTPWARREKMMEQELSRLNLAYRNFKPEEDFLLVRTFVTLSPEQSTDAKGKETYTLPIAFSKAPEALYFPYDFLEERIVVMPHKLDMMMNSQIDKNQYDFIKKGIRNSAKNVMIVRLRTMEADTSRPYEIDGLNQWVLKAEIVSLEIWNRQGSLLWEYTAPWYVSPNTVKLNSLYNGKPASSPEIGAVKPLYLENSPE